MHKGKMSEAQIGALVSALHREYAQHNARLYVRRLLIEMGTDTTQHNDTGTNVVAPFDKSSLIIKTVTGDAVQTVQHYASRFSANPPIPYVVQTPIRSARVSAKMKETAADEENLLKSMWETAGGPRLQNQIAWSQAWGRVGWYFTLPRDAAWGLPDREYFTSLTDDELVELRKGGKITEVEDGKYAESAESWFDRTREKIQEQAINGESMFILRAYPPDMVLPRYDDDGNLKFGAIVMEMPQEDCKPGSEMMKAAGKYAEVEDPSQYGIWMEGNKVVGGIPRGGEPHSTKGRSWSLIIGVTADEIYYMVAPRGANFTQGRIIYSAYHGAGIVPLIPAPAYVTDSRKPGAEYSSPCEPVFAMQPLLNQAETLLSNVASYNSIPRWVIEDESGNLVRDPETGQPKMVDQDAVTPGTDPSQAAVVGGKIKQLEIKADILVDLMRFYSAEMEKARPSPIMTGSAGTSGPAWNLRQQIEQINENLREPAQNHARAMKTIFQLWIRWMRILDLPVVMGFAPGKRNSKTNTRALIEVDPADLTEAIVVEQDSQSASDRIVLDQVGIEKLEKGLIDLETYYERYAREEDPEDAIMRLYLYRIEQAVMFGDNNQIQPGSLLSDVVQAVRGQITYEMLRRSPNFAIATAEAMTAEQQQMAQQQLPAGGFGSNQIAETGGNIAEVSGIRQPGLGMPMDLQGGPAAMPASVGAMG